MTSSASAVWLRPRKAGDAVRRLIFATAAGVVLAERRARHWRRMLRAPANDDPWEHLNRRFYSFNEGLDRAIIRPAAMLYSHAVPSPLRAGTSSQRAEQCRRAAGHHQRHPASPVQTRRQGDRPLPARIRRSVWAACSMSPLAPAWIMKAPISRSRWPAMRAGQRGHRAPISTCRWSAHRRCAAWSARSADARRLESRCVGSRLSAQDRDQRLLGRALVTGLDLRAESDGALKTLTSDATDPYATIRSAYLQNLQSQINGESDKPVQALPSDFDDATAPPPATPNAQGAPRRYPAARRLRRSGRAGPTPPCPPNSPATPNAPAPGADDGE